MNLSKKQVFRLALTLIVFGLSGVAAAAVYHLTNGWAETIYNEVNTNLLKGFVAQMAVLLAPALTALISLVILESIVDAIYFLNNIDGGYQRVLSIATKQQKRITP